MISMCACSFVGRGRRKAPLPFLLYCISSLPVICVTLGVNQIYIAAGVGPNYSICSARSHCISTCGRSFQGRG